MIGTKRAAAVGFGALVVEALLAALLARAGFGPLPLLVANVVIVAFAILIMIDRSVSIFDEIGLGGSPMPGAIAGLLMAAPLAITLYFTRQNPVVVQPLHLLRQALAIALADEVFFRGFAVRLLVRRAKVGAVPAVVATAAAVLLARVLSTIGTGSVGDVAQVAVLGAATQVWFGFVFVAWEEDLWVPLALHFGLNLGWSLFEGAVVTDAGSPWSHVGRLLCLLASIGVTIGWRRLRPAKPAAS